MNVIYDKINAATGGKYGDVRFSQIAFEQNNNAVVTVVCDGEMYKALVADSTELKKLVTDTCAMNCDISLRIVEADRSAKHLRDEVIKFMSGFPFTSSVAQYVTAPTPTSVRLKMHKSMYNLAQTDFMPRLNEFLSNTFIDKIDVGVDMIELTALEQDDSSVSSVAEISQKKMPSKKSYVLGELKPIVGEIDASEAASAATVSGNNDDVTVCGVLTMSTELMSKGSGAKRSRPYEKFLLYDGETTLQCRFFPRDVTVFSSGARNKKCCVTGNTAVERGRTGETSMTVRSIALCEADGLEVVQNAPEPNRYITVTPKPYEEYVQASLFSGEEHMPASLKGTFVAFDFETTGLSIEYDRPTELGAVKIVDGMITETFHTMIDPLRPIPEEVTKKTGITDSMVKGQPRFEDVLPDFYKFSFGAALVGHNIAFDFPFLIKYGNRFGWAFGDRVTYDTLGIAPRALPGIEVLTLDNVLSLLGLVNDNAHRALSDATATAKAFIAMCKKLG